MGVDYKVQDNASVPEEEIRSFMDRFDHILVHFDIDVLDEHFFSFDLLCQPRADRRWFRRRKMTMESAAGVLKVITEESDVVGFYRG